MAIKSHYHTVGYDLIDAIETIQANIRRVIEWNLRRHIQFGVDSSLHIDELDDLGNITKHAHLAHVRILEGYHGNRGPFEWDFEVCHTLHHVIETSCLEYQERDEWMTKLETAIKAAEDFAEEEVRRLEANEAPF